MAAKGKAHPLNSAAHTAGIFSDMSIDGPLIGTLVLVIDRAKNLPNRKTIGKQDPYCAARLGKEAKKTTTDIRGGQTPKWDQELRFTVHDCPDYYQLKVSVFNDDKRTDLIGETWIDLRSIIVSGGGQSDQWHQLNCKGKYAGDIRIEITYYDSRPKPDKPAVKAKPALENDPYGSLPRGGRRPLPSNPVTGQSPSPSVPDHAPTPPRPQPKPPTSYIPNQSPLQAMEYSVPPPLVPRHESDPFPLAAPSGGYSTPNHHHITLDRHDTYPIHADEQEYSPEFQDHGFDQHHSRHQYDDAPIPVDLPEHDDFQDDDRPPPPPVHRTRNNSGGAHETMFRSSFDMGPKAIPPTMRQDVLRNEAHRNSVSAPTTYPGRPTYRPYDSAPAQGLANSSHHSTPEPPQPSSPRHHSYDATFEAHSRPRQPSVEDVPDSPSHMTSAFRNSGSRGPQYDHPEFDYNKVPTPAPLNIGGRGSAASSHYTPSGTPSHRHHDANTNGYHTTPSPVASRDYHQTGAAHSPYDSYDNHGPHYPNHHSELDDTRVDRPSGFGLPPVPPSLVPGVDSSLALEISSRINEERKTERRRAPQHMATPPRGRQMIDSPASYSQNSSPQAFGTPQHNQDRSSITYSGGPSPAMIKGRAVSPNPSPMSNTHHTIKRKSISPAPPTEDRRLSGIPFGPDSFDILNPSLVSSSSKDSGRSNLEPDKIITHDGREIDPSDHLPMESWAPEPEPKQPKKPSGSFPPSGVHSLPNSAKKPLRVGRPQSMAAPAPQYISDLDTSPTTPTGRNRLQKKAHRSTAALPTMSGALGGSSPLAPLPYNHQRDFTPPKALPRANTFDYPNENHAPVSYGSHGRNTASAPPIPAKIPVHARGSSGGVVMSGALPAPGGGGGSWHGHGGGSGPMSLADEMRSIDIGTGRARRHQGRY